MSTLFLGFFDSPVGRLHIIHDGNTLYVLDFEEFDARLQLTLRRRQLPTPVTAPLPAPFLDALTRYFAGDIHSLAMLPVDTGGTPFQQQVWAGLRRIPAGRTCSYRDLALDIGNAKAQRAVGMANGRNPIPLVIPCHRVISHDGGVGGFSSALWRKRWLLAHEGVRLPG